MLVVGFVLVVVEMYIPGFGFPGVSGILLLLGGIVMVSHGDVVLALIVSLVIVALLCAALSISIRSASRGRLAKSKLVLHETFRPEVAEGDMRYFVGKTGVSNTTLRPAGIGEFDGVKLNVVSDGEFIPSGKPIVVEKVEGNRIFVRWIGRV
ncbi:MAG: hypothetical protein GX558_12680 [Clostridiales bacterium]|nr:hypothetical protein [Clostridiales bacterium]